MWYWMSTAHMDGPTKRCGDYLDSKAVDESAMHMQLLNTDLKGKHEMQAGRK